MTIELSRKFNTPFEDNTILKLTFEFSLKIIHLSEVLNSNHQYIISKQILKSATSIGANSYEAQNAESDADFIHKFKIAAKEADETHYWLLLCNHADNYPDTTNLLNELEIIKKVINRIISTSKNK